MMVFVCSTCFGDVFRVTFIANPVSIVLCIQYTCYTTHAVLQGLSVSISMVSIADTVLTFAKTSIPYNEAFSRTMISCKMTLAGFVKYWMLGPADVVGFPILQPLAKVSDHQLGHSLLIFFPYTLFFYTWAFWGFSNVFFPLRQNCYVRSSEQQPPRGPMA